MNLKLMVVKSHHKLIIESNFGVKVKAEEFGEIITFKDFYDYINKKLSLKNV